MGWAATLGAAGVVTGCSWGREPDPPPPDPLEPLLAQTRLLADQYDGAIEAHPGLAELLGPIRHTHREHEAALLALIDRPELATPPPAGTAGPVPTPTDDASNADDEDADDEDPAKVRERLRSAETAGQTDAAAACLAAPSERAALLGSIAAARATHAEVLA